MRARVSPGTMLLRKAGAGWWRRVHVCALDVHAPPQGERPTPAARPTAPPPPRPALQAMAVGQATLVPSSAAGTAAALPEQAFEGEYEDDEEEWEEEEEGEAEETAAEPAGRAAGSGGGGSTTSSPLVSVRTRSARSGGQARGGEEQRLVQLARARPELLQRILSMSAEEFVADWRQKAAMFRCGFGRLAHAHAAVGAAALLPAAVPSRGDCSCTALCGGPLQSRRVVLARIPHPSARVTFISLTLNPPHPPQPPPPPPPTCWPFRLAGTSSICRAPLPARPPRKTSSIAY